MTGFQSGNLKVFKNAFFVSVILFISGSVIQYFFGNFPLGLFKTPVNIILFTEFLVLIPLLWILFHKRKIIRWLSSTEAAVISMIFFTFLVFLMALIPQGGHPDPLGLKGIVDTWMFAVSVMFLLVTLGFAILRRLIPLSRRNIIFTMNHFGLWLVLLAGSLGQADKEEVIIQAGQDQLVWYGQNEYTGIMELPFALELQEFIVKEYPPRLALFHQAGALVKARGDQWTSVDEPGIFTIDSFDIHLETYFPEAFVKPDTILNVQGIAGTAPAARVRVTPPSGKKVQGWISPGGSITPPRSLELSPDFYLALLPPEPAYYGARVRLYTQSGIDGESRLIEVNHPIKAEGWWIYLQSFDQAMGRKAERYTFLAVKDPWLPLVYTGLCFMIAGALGLLFLSPKSGKRENL